MDEEFGKEVVFQVGKKSGEAEGSGVEVEFEEVVGSGEEVGFGEEEGSVEGEASGEEAVSGVEM